MDEPRSNRRRNGATAGNTEAQKTRWRSVGKSACGLLMRFDVIQSRTHYSAERRLRQGGKYVWERSFFFDLLLDDIYLYRCGSVSVCLSSRPGGEDDVRGE